MDSAVVISLMFVLKAYLIRCFGWTDFVILWWPVSRQSFSEGGIASEDLGVFL